VNRARDIFVWGYIYKSVPISISTYGAKRFEEAAGQRTNLHICDALSENPTLKSCCRLTTFPPAPPDEQDATLPSFGPAPTNLEARYISVGTRAFWKGRQAGSSTKASSTLCLLRVKLEAVRSENTPPVPLPLRFESSGNYIQVTQLIQYFLLTSQSIYKVAHSNTLDEHSISCTCAFAQHNTYSEGFSTPLSLALFRFNVSPVKPPYLRPSLKY